MDRLPSQGNTDLEDLGYISTVPTSDAPYAVFRLYKGTHHMFTSNQSVANAYLAQGYKQEAVIDYSLNSARQISVPMLYGLTNAISLS
jgi:hypothetical protein